MRRQEHKQLATDALGHSSHPPEYLRSIDRSPMHSPHPSPISPYSVWKPVLPQPPNDHFLFPTYRYRHLFLPTGQIVDTSAGSSITDGDDNRHVHLGPSRQQNTSINPSLRASTTQGKDQVQRRAAFEVVVCGCLVVRPVKHRTRSVNARDQLKTKKKGVKEGKFIHLLPTEDQPLLDGRDAFFLLDALFYPGDLACYCVSWVTGRVAYGVFLRVRSSRANKRVWFD